MKDRININIGPSMSLLTIVFLILKLTNVIDWSWWWILAPIWMPFAIIIGIGTLLMLVVILGKLIVGLLEK